MGRATREIGKGREEREGGERRRKGKRDEGSNCSLWAR